MRWLKPQIPAIEGFYLTTEITEDIEITILSLMVPCTPHLVSETENTQLIF